MIACPHQDATATRRACVHLLEGEKPFSLRYYRRFTGVRLDYDIVCAQCREQPEEIEAHLRTICAECFEGVSSGTLFGGFLGSPAVLERATSLSFAHETVRLGEPFPFRVLDMQPVEALSRSVWVALTEQGRLARIDLDAATVDWVAEAPAGSVDLERAMGLHMSPDGEMAAVVNSYGQQGVVLDLKTGEATMRLERDGHHGDVSLFSLAFFVLEGRLLLAHGTEWNRLDVSDPRTGELLTSRVSPVYERDKPRPAHYLDYFHCGLSVSPGQEWMVDNGWVWHPVGVVTVWNLRRWVQENVWESEDGPSKKDLCWRYYFWDGPLCWIDGQTLAVWGYGDDDNNLIPAVRVFDVPSGEELRWFAGPMGGTRLTNAVEGGERQRWSEPLALLAFDTYLFSYSHEYGTSVWDVETGERLLDDASLCPLRYHRGAKQFLTLLPDGGFQVSRLIGQVLKPFTRDAAIS